MEPYRNPRYHEIAFGYRDLAAAQAGRREQRAAGPRRHVMVPRRGRQIRFGPTDLPLGAVLSRNGRPRSGGHDRPPDALG
jgi:hypothetical protein